MSSPRFAGAAAIAVTSPPPPPPRSCHGHITSNTTPPLPWLRRHYLDLPVFSTATSPPPAPPRPRHGYIIITSSTFTKATSPLSLSDAATRDIPGEIDSRAGGFSLVLFFVFYYYVFQPCILQVRATQYERRDRAKPFIYLFFFIPECSGPLT